jgi:AbrB family looped-hinge helix DNA binding protein
MEDVMVDNAKILAKGQLTLPKDIREALGVSTGDRVTFIKRNNQVIIMNSALYAMKMLQEGMKGEAENAGLYSDEDVTDMIMKMRAEGK